MPVQGGLLSLGPRRLGDFWGFLAGWWNWTASFLLGSAYAVLFAIPRLLLPRNSPDAIITWSPRANRRHHLHQRARHQMVGRISTCSKFRLLPIAVMTVMGLTQWKHNHSPVGSPTNRCSRSSALASPSDVWLYSGYEQLSTVADRSRKSPPHLPRALALVVPPLHRHVFPADLLLPGRARQLAAMHGDILRSAKLIGGPAPRRVVALAPWSQSRAPQQYRPSPQRACPWH